MGSYTGSDKRLKYLFENGGGGGGSANIWIGTKAEYEAQASQIADDTAVFITDDEIQSLIVSSYDVYSTEEKEVGVFVDGKPLYQKTLFFNGAIPRNTWTNHNILDVDKIWVYDAFGKRSTDYRYNGINYFSSDDYMAIAINRTQIYIGYPTATPMTNGYITVKYTKTTDVAGSGIFVPSGAAAVHYSTTEQVIGTWINGKPLYRKTFYIANSVTMNAQYDVSHDLVNIDEIINKSGTYYDDADARQYPFPNMRVTYSESIWIACFVPSNGTPIIAIQSGGYRYGNISKISVTLDYTKTTD